MKKIYALLLTIILCLSASLPVFADAQVLTASGAKAERNEYVYVTLKLEDCEPANTLAITYEYDSNVLKKIANRCKWSMEGDLSDFSINKNEGVWYSGNTSDVNGEICVLGFRISDTAPIGRTTVRCTVTVKNEATLVDEYTVEAIVEVTCAHTAGENAVGTKVDGENHKYACELCGTDIVEPHIWDKGVVTQSPSTTEVGIKTYTCTFCKATYEEEIPMLEPEPGDEPGGDTPGGNEPGGDTPGGDTPGGNEPGGDEPGGDTPGGDTPGGNEPGGDTPGGNEPGGDTPGGNEPGGDEPGGDTPGGTTPPSEDEGNQGGTTPPSEDEGNQGGTTPPSEDEGNQGGTETPDGDEGNQDSTETPDGDEGNQDSTETPDGDEGNQDETEKPGEDDTQQTEKPDGDKKPVDGDKDPGINVGAIFTVIVIIGAIAGAAFYFMNKKR